MKTTVSCAQAAQFVVALCLATLPALAGETLPQPYHPCLAGGVMKSVVFIGALEKQPDPKLPPKPVYFGTGFLITIDDVYYLVTAKHVVKDSAVKEEDVVIFLNGPDGRLRQEGIGALKRQFNVTWITPEDSDLALIPFSVEPDFDVKVVPESLFLESTQLLELQDLFFISFQPGIDTPTAITPVVRRGMVSVKNSDNTFYMDAFAFPGNSGSPVFVKPSPTTFVEQGTTVGDPRGCRFVGFIGEYLPYQEVAFSAQTRRPRVVFEENTGLARVWPVQSLRKAVASAEFQSQHRAVRAAAQKAAPH